MACRFGLGSVTYAQAAQNILARQGIRSKLIKLGVGESPKGCAYGIETDCSESKKASLALKRNGISFRELKQ